MTRAWTIALLLIVRVAAAHADARTDARALFATGDAAYRRGEFARAIDAFERSYALYPAPLTLFDLAQCHRRAGSADEALRRYRLYLEREPNGRFSETAKRKISELEAARAKDPTTPPSSPSEEKSAEQADSKNVAGDAKSRAAADARSENTSDAKSKTASNAKSENAGDAKSKSVGDTKSENAGDAKSKAAGDAKSKSAGDAKSENAGDAKSKAAGGGKFESAGDAKSKTGDAASEAVRARRLDSALKARRLDAASKLGGAARLKLSGTVALAVGAGAIAVGAILSGIALADYEDLNGAQPGTRFDPATESRMKLLWPLGLALAGAGAAAMVAGAVLRVAGARRERAVAWTPWLDGRGAGFALGGKF